MKVKQNMQKICMKNTSSPVRIKSGNVRLVLTDRDGRTETVMDHNMQTNAINEMLANCGWLNRDNLDQANLITLLLGGVMLYDTALTEAASNMVAPAGVYMIANAAYGVSNGSSEGDPTEMGSYVAGESGLQQDGSFLFVYEWGFSQGNCPAGKAITSLCATNFEYGYGGEGNGSGLTRSAKQALTLSGTPTLYSLPGFPCHLSLTDSGVYSVELDQANAKIIIKKYCLPISKVNLKGTPTEPYLIDETEITMPANMVSATLGDYNSTSGMQDVEGKLVVLNTATSSSHKWGDNFTQYMWEIDVVNGTVTESTLLNTSGVNTLHCLMNPMWLGKDCVAFIDGYDGGSWDYYRDSRVIYSMKRTNGTWGAIQNTTNPYGHERTSNYGNVRGEGWDYGIMVAAGKGIVNTGAGSNLMFDYENNTALPTNQNFDPGYLTPPMRSVDAPLIAYKVGSADNLRTISIMRLQTCIATIFNLSSPVTKDGTKTMKLQYSFNFDEEEE